MVTSDWGKFGYRETDLAIDMLKAYKDRNWTKLANDYFDWSSMKPAFNMNSGFVFLTDDDYNVVMLNDDGELDLYITTPYAGVEGFYNEIMEDFEDLEDEDKEYMRSLQGHFGQGSKKKRKYFGRQYDTGGLFNLFPDLTKGARKDLAKAYMQASKTLPAGTDLAMLTKLNNYKPKNKKLMNGSCQGFSRVVVPGELQGFTRVNMVLPENMEGYTLNDYELNDYTLNEMQGRTARRVARWYKKNAPWSYIGTAVAGIVVADILTKGAVRKKLGLKKGR